MDFHFEEVALKPLCQQVEAELTSLLLDKYLSLFIEVEDNVGVWCDPMRVTQVVVNILSNAIKFSPMGATITIRAKRIQKENDALDWLLVRIRDEGVGIPEAELQAIFEQFIQSSKTKNGSGGTGLGLSICREIIAAHGGRIWAENNPDKGASFCFELPCKKPQVLGFEI